MPVVPPAPRFRIENNESGMRIIIPHRKNWGVILFIVVGLVLSIVSEVSFSKINKTNPAFAIDQISNFVFIGLIVAILVWQVVGREVLQVTTHSISIANQVFFLSIPKEYESQYIKDLRISQPFDSNWLTFIFGQYLIAFDYGARTYRFGRDCDEAEAKMILAEIAQRYPQYLPLETGKKKKE